MNLIICCTPFQILLATYIVRKYPDQDFAAIVIYGQKNDKVKFYSEKLKQSCRYFKMISINNRHHLLLNLITWRFSLFPKKFDKVFLASIDSLAVHIILSWITMKTIMTFDDGAANIFKNSLYYKEIEESKTEKLVRFILRVKYNQNRIKQISCLHYTIYDLPNIIENTQKITLIDKILISPEKERKHRSIFLGQSVFPEDKACKDIIEKVIRNFNIDYYFPHPREQYHIDNVQYIHTPLLFEDYIVNQLSDYDITIYTFFSSAAINVMNIKGIEIKCIQLQGFEQESQYMQEFGISVLPFYY